MSESMHLIHHQQSTQSIADYLAQLLKDRKQLAAFPNVFAHVERLLDEGKSSETKQIINIIVCHTLIGQRSQKILIVISFL